MSNLRREQTRKQFGFDSERQIRRQERAKQRALKERERDQLRREEIERNSLYKTLIKGAFGFDVADAVLGFLETIGDVLSGLLALTYVYLSLFVVRSLRLTVAVLGVAFVDLLMGLVPGIGTLLDVVFCGNYINRTMIKGYVEGDEKMRRRVNIVSVVSLLIIVGVVTLMVHLLGWASDAWSSKEWSLWPKFAHHANG